VISPPSVTSWKYIFCAFLKQMQAKFKRCMLMHREMKLKLEKKKKVLEDEIAMFIEKKANAELLQSQASVSTPVVSLKRDKDHKK